VTIAALGNGSNYGSQHCNHKGQRLLYLGYHWVEVLKVVGVPKDTPFPQTCSKIASWLLSNPSPTAVAIHCTLHYNRKDKETWLSQVALVGRVLVLRSGLGRVAAVAAAAAAAAAPVTALRLSDIPLHMFYNNILF